MADNETTFNATADGAAEALGGMSTLSFAVTAAAIVVPTAVLLVRKLLQRPSGEISLDDILASDAAARGGGAAAFASGVEEEDEVLGDPMALVNSSPWPTELPGLVKIDRYYELKDEALDRCGLDFDEAEEMPDSERQPLRHALMDRCQAHVAWLLRLEREQRSIDRMARRGMISASDFTTFSKFAERLDAEVSEVREEAAWLCGDEAQARRAADEIWRIAVQIWQQRRQQQIKDAADDKERVEAQSQRAEGAKSAGASAKSAGQKAEARAEDAKKSLKGLKGGFLDKGTSGGASKKKNGKKAAQEPALEPVEVFIGQNWPSALPGKKAVEAYEQLKAKTLRAAPTPSANPQAASSMQPPLAEGEPKQRLRNALMERCQAHVPSIRVLQQEQVRIRACLERAKWRSGVGAPTAEDLGKFRAFDELIKVETSEVVAEAEWLGDRDGRAGMGERIWPTAFEIDAKLRARHDERGKELKDQHDKCLRVYAAGEAKKWPKTLPGAKQREEYERLKCAALARLSTAAQALMLEGKNAPTVCGSQAARQLRAVLMARCQQTVPIIQRLQAEARAVQTAAERQHIDANEYAAFEQTDVSVKAEIDAVKLEAEWLSDDSGTRQGMGEQVWPAAFQIYAKRKAEIAKIVAQSNAAKEQAAAEANAAEDESPQSQFDKQQKDDARPQD